MITLETRREGYRATKPTMETRQNQCILTLVYLGGRATASEVAQYLYEHKVIPMPIRNYSHPRLNELCKKGIVEVVGRKYDKTSNRNVSLYGLKEPETNEPTVKEQRVGGFDPNEIVLWPAEEVYSEM